VITASMLYDQVLCPYRPWQDLHGDLSKRDKISPFVQLLWEKGTKYEQQVISELKIPFLDLSSFTQEEKENRTLEAMKNRISLIYSGRISFGNLLGEPDLIRLQDEGYVAGDIKSGSGEEGDEYDRKPKIHYAVQLALYNDILRKKGISNSRIAFVWDVHGEEVIYEFDEEFGKRNPTTLWKVYQQTLSELQDIVDQKSQTKPAFCSSCKLCHWRSRCLENLTELDDLTLLPGLGRSKRDVLEGEITTVTQLSQEDIKPYVIGNNTVFRGIGINSLNKFKARAELVKMPNGSPYLKEEVVFPEMETELFFDIEVDPMQDLCYLHGFVKRKGKDNASETYYSFFANAVDPQSEAKAFREAWEFVRMNKPCSIYYYSKYERTIWRKLRERYPDVCSEEEMEDMFDPINAVDLYYDVVTRKTEWPTRDHSIKTLAGYLGFHWRDNEPSGAASIEWFQRWTETGDFSIKQRILEYNEDDCVATRVLLDGICHLELHN